MRQYFTLILALLLSFSIHGQGLTITEATDVDDIKNLVIEELRNSGYATEPVIEAVNMASDEIIPGVKENLDLFISLKDQYVKLTSEKSKRRFVRAHSKDLEKLGFDVSKLSPENADKIFITYATNFIVSQKYKCAAMIAERSNEISYNKLQTELAKYLDKIRNGERVKCSDLVAIGEDYGIPEDVVMKIIHDSGFTCGEGGFIK